MQGLIKLKKILEFNYPEDEELFKIHLNGPEATWFLDNILSKLKYDENHRDEIHDISASEYINEFRDWFLEEIEARNILL